MVTGFTAANPTRDKVSLSSTQCGRGRATVRINVSRQSVLRSWCAGAVFPGHNQLGIYEDCDVTGKVCWLIRAGRDTRVSLVRFSY